MTEPDYTGETGQGFNDELIAFLEGPKSESARFQAQHEEALAFCTRRCHVKEMLTAGGLACAHHIMFSRHVDRSGPAKSLLLKAAAQVLPQCVSEVQKGRQAIPLIRISEL